MKYEVIPDACRVCLRKSRSCRSIFKPHEDEDMAPFEKLKLVTGVNVTKDDEDFPALPQLICRTCEVSVNMAYGLRNRARKSDQIIHIYCNRLNKDNIIVELDTGRKFKLSKELTLKVVRKNKSPSSPLPSITQNIDIEEHFDESYLDEDMIGFSNSDEVEEIREVKEPLLDDEEFIKGNRDEIIDLNEEDHFSSDDESKSKPVIDIDDDNEVEQEEKPKPTQLYDAEEIAKRLRASEKYEVVSWKQEEQDDSVPVFRLRLKGVDAKQLTNDFICEVCGNIYRQRHRLTEHMRRHNNERSYACEICNKRFAIAEGLRRHVLTHGAQKPFKCNYCTRRFYNPSARKAHEIVHSGAKPYVCKICDRAFAYTCSLRKHMLIHENKKLYRCDYCDKEFRLQHHLKQHAETQIHKDAVAEQMNSEENSVLLKAEV